MIFIARPEVLHSQETLTVEQALKHATIEELTAFRGRPQGEPTVLRWFGDVSRYFEQALGMQPIGDEILRGSMSERVALRNLVTHRRGVVDHRALEGWFAASALQPGPPSPYPSGRRIQGHGWSVDRGPRLRREGSPKILRAKAPLRITQRAARSAAGRFEDRGNPLRQMKSRGRPRREIGAAGLSRCESRRALGN